MKTAAEIIGALASIIAALIATAAWRLAAETFRRDHRPILRVVGLSQGSAVHPVLEVVADRQMLMDRVLLKNIGRGSGLTVIAYDPKNQGLIGDVDSVEVLGSAESEERRPGRVPMGLRKAMVMNQTLELYHQDILSAWHLTRFRPDPPNRIECSFVGPIKARDVPGAVKILGTVAKP